MHMGCFLGGYMCVRQLLADYMCILRGCYMRRGVVFDRRGKATVTATQWFEDNITQVLAWSMQSPDINPIEYLWVHLKKKLKEYPTPPKGMHEEWERVAEEWNKITPDTL